MQYKSGITDSFEMFLDSPNWDIIKIRLSTYSDKLNDEMRANIRKNDMHTVNRCDAKIEAISEIIDIIKRIPKAMKSGKLDINKNDRSISYE